MNEFINKYKGHKFGSLTVVGPELYYMDYNGNIIPPYCVYCDCDCGNKFVPVGINDLMNKKTTSCGCKGRDTFVRVINSGNMGHGDSKGGPYVDLYKKWESLKNNLKYRNLKVRDEEKIEFYQEWNRYPVFKIWALENGWVNGMVLDRRDKNKGYTPDNCFWNY